MTAALRYGGGQPLAIEFLMNGIPANLPPPTGARAPASPTTAPVGASGALAALRQHPRFNMLRTLVQVES